MRAGLNPFSFLIISIAGWINQRQQQVIEYLIEENRVLREQIGKRRMRFSDNQRCRLAAKAKKLSRKALRQIRIVTSGPQWSAVSQGTMRPKPRGGKLAARMGRRASLPCR